MMFNPKRRTFVKQTFLLSTILIFFNGKLFAQVSISNDLQLLLLDLFPKINGVSLVDPHYFDFIISHSKISNLTKQTILKGIRHLNLEALQTYKKLYKNLDPMQREELILALSKTTFGDKWLYLIMTFIFESAFGDPIYGGNPKELGWKVTKHTSGKPRPKELFV